jgi:hypothetical protein
MTRRVNYLNNKDILKEIHKSKTAYCIYSQPEYSEYDIIIYDLAEIPKLLKKRRVKEVDEEGNEKTVTMPPEAKAARAKRLTVLEQDASLLLGKKIKADEVDIDPVKIPDHEIIFRVMTWDHVPVAPASAPKVVKGKKAKVVLEEESEELLTEYDEAVPEIIPPTPIKYVKVNFPPFQHYKLTEEGELICIGKSHWIGDLETGSFSKDHGKITNKLALMYMKLCERYATRSNWRGYTYNDEMRSQALLQLSQIGLQFDEAKSANPFAYYTAAITNSFTRVLNIEKRNQNIRDDILEMNDFAPSYTRQNSWGGDGGGHGADE